MSEQPASLAGVPEWDIADRMRKALRQADVGPQEMAGYLDVTRQSVGNWINGRIEPSVQTLRLWALRTGVSYDWLRGSQNGTGTQIFSQRGESPQRRKVINSRYVSHLHLVAA